MSEYMRLGACRFCGQMKEMYGYKEDVEQERIDEDATLQCPCAEAMRYRGKLATEQGVKMLLGEEAINHGFRYSLPSVAINAIMTICGHIMDGVMDNVKFEDEGGDGIRLKLDGNHVKIKRSTKREAEV